MTSAMPTVEWDSGLTNAWDSIASFVPKLLIFLVVLIIGWFIAKSLQKLTATVLEKVGFTRLIDRAGLSRFFQGGTTPISLIAMLVYYFVLLIALQLALSAFGENNPVSQIVNDIVAFLPRIVVAIIIVVVAAAVANAVKDMLAAGLSSLSYGEMLAKIAAGFIIALGVIAALGQIGIALVVTMPVLIAVLATVGGILVVGVGGGLIKPMQHRWEGWLSNIEMDTRKASSAGGSEPASGGTDYRGTAGEL